MFSFSHPLPILLEERKSQKLLFCNPVCLSLLEPPPTHLLCVCCCCWETMELFKWSLTWMFPLLCLLLGVDGFLVKNVRLEKCLHASSSSSHEMDKVGLGDCKPHSPQHQWSWDAATRAVVNLRSGQCLTAREWQGFALAPQLEPCGASGLQAWVCSKKGHLSVQGLGLHLSTTPGGHKAFLSREKDKFSRWRTEAGGIVCAVDLAAAPELSHPMEGPEGTLAWVPESKTILSPETHTPLVDPTTTSPGDGNEAVVTSALPRKEETSLGQERHTLYKKHDAGNQRKGAGSRYSGTNWKTVMLVLCPLAFILGLIILALNIHYNKKKKTLSALKSRAERSQKGGHAECLPFPGTVTGSPRSPVIPASPSPSLKHGEILIEWKDGTITPLFDNMNYQIC